jgi:hypothetical protein
VDAKKKAIGAAGVAAAAVAGIAVKRKLGGATVYTVRPTDDGWAVAADGSKRASSTHKTKREAVDAGRSLAKSKAPSQLIIHRVDGSVQDSHTYEKE